MLTQLNSRMFFLILLTLFRRTTPMVQVSISQMRAPQSGLASDFRALRNWRPPLKRLDIQRERFFSELLDSKLRAVRSDDSYVSVDRYNAVQNGKTQPSQKQDDCRQVSLQFSHIHLYVDEIDDVEKYKILEDQLNSFDELLNSRKGQLLHETDSQRLNIRECRKLWKQIFARPSFQNGDETLQSQSEGESTAELNRDVVRQLIAGLGFRITGARMAEKGGDKIQANKECINTRTVLVTSRDPMGVKFVVTAIGGESDNGCYEESIIGDAFDHFNGYHTQRFFRSHDNRQGIAVLGFQVDRKDGASSSLDTIFDRYCSLHPQLLLTDDNGTAVGIREINNSRLLEVFAYYQNSDQTIADPGTVLRFIEQENTAGTVGLDTSLCLPGLKNIAAKFPSFGAQAAYSDHWVSNVFSRTSFLSTLKETLGFSPRVNFNAGVVAAGDSQIESTVTGNTCHLQTITKDIALRDQHQVYLPINNALSSVGHVNGFLQEMGQGVQHVASRVNNLVAFVQRANDYREITGEGLTFLSIPRSYYGVLTKQMLLDAIQMESDNELSGVVNILFVDALYNICKKLNFVSSDGSVDVNLTHDTVEKGLDKEMTYFSEDMQRQWRRNALRIVDTVLRSRFINLHALIGKKLTDAEYLGIVRNQILVDSQGKDLLFQIFTSKILQRKATDEAPFLEFIQRLCGRQTFSSNHEKLNEGFEPGCGGFGIRNFLTLFLSIEVSKAMDEAQRAKTIGDRNTATYYESMVNLFKDQLDEANPLLTDIANAMNAEGVLEQQLASVAHIGDGIYKSLATDLFNASVKKEQANRRLMHCNAKYQEKMKVLREEGVLA